VKQKIQTKRLAISNVGKDSGKRTKMAAWEQATRDRKRIVSQDDAIVPVHGRDSRTNRRLGRLVARSTPSI
jgi:hypothetical protein